MLSSPSFPMPLAQLRPTETQPGATEVASPGNAIPATQGVAVTTTTSQPATQESGAQAQKPSMLDGLKGIAPFAIIIVLLYLFMFRGQKKTEKTRKEMLATMKKGDEVMTIGGMVARIHAIDEDEVVLKIDESANVKARYKKSAIQQVLTAEDKAK